MQAPEEDDDGRGGVDGGAGSPSGPEGSGAPSGPEGSGAPSGPEGSGAPSGQRLRGTSAQRAPWTLETRTTPERKALPLREPPRARGSRGPHGPHGPHGPQGPQGRLPRLRSQMSELYLFHGAPSRGRKGILTVPFLSYVDAEVARRYLMAGAETYHGRVHWNLTVTGCDLFIRLTAEDSDLLQISTASLLHRLSIVVQTMQHFVPQFCCK
ncbi:hypothetical protein QTO34_000174, partial [Cnephaeus nilssonii]